MENLRLAEGDSVGLKPEQKINTSRAENFERRVAYITIFFPFVVVLVGGVFLWRQPVNLIDVSLCIGMYTLTMLGITMGYHRLFTHRSFKCGNGLKLILGIAGSMAAQGPIYFWVASHRHHHKHSDRDNDPHSPNNYEASLLERLKKFWHSHIGWMLTKNKPLNYIRLVPDLIRDPFIFRINKLYFVWVFTGLILPGVIGGLLTFSWYGMLTGVFWGGFLRMFLVHQSTWTINSICHLFGSESYISNDKSKNNFICAILTFGEGWHNNHHAFQTSARHGLKWWQIDFTFILIKVMAVLRLSWDIQLPEKQMLEKKAIQTIQQKT